MDLQNTGGITALIQASYAGHLDIVRFLCNRGTALDLRNSKDCASLCMKGCIIRLLHGIFTTVYARMAQMHGLTYPITLLLEKHPH